VVSESSAIERSDGIEAKTVRTLASKDIADEVPGGTTFAERQSGIAHFGQTPP
jgi:hypothetical protein